MWAPPGRERLCGSRPCALCSAFHKGLNHALPFCPYVYWKYLRKFDSTFFFFFLSHKVKGKRQCFQRCPSGTSWFSKDKGPCVFILLSWLGELELIKCSQMQVNQLPLPHGKETQKVLPSVYPLTLHSLKWWQPLEPDSPSTRYAIGHQLKWHFITVL